jgi:hypothetical protein
MYQKFEKHIPVSNSSPFEYGCPSYSLGSKLPIKF